MFENSWTRWWEMACIFGILTILCIWAKYVLGPGPDLKMCKSGSNTLMRVGKTPTFAHSAKRYGRRGLGPTTKM